MRAVSKPHINTTKKWNGRDVYDAYTCEYLGYAVGEPWSDGIEGYITLRQDEEGQTIKPYVCTGFVVLDRPPSSCGTD